MGLVRRTIKDLEVYYDDSDYYDEEDGVRPAFKYWERHLDRDQIAVYFHAAKARGEAKFETNHGKKFKLLYRDGRYTIERLHSSSDY